MDINKIFIIVTGQEDFEYYCMECKQLRLCCSHPFKGCGNCNSQNVITGAIGSLDKKELKQCKS